MTQQGKALTYAYDNAGNMTSVNYGSKTVSYSYDLLGQLIRADDPYDTTAGSAGTTWVYSYDLGGNMTSKKAYAYATGTVGTAVQTIPYTYGDSNWKDKLTAYNGAAISYDAIGNPTSDGTWTYTWAKGRQLQSMSKSGTSVSYTYNEDGLRVQKNVSGTVTSYILHGKNVVELNQGGNSLHFFYGADGSPAVVVYNGAGYGYVKNLQGDVVSIVNSSGAEVVHYSYDAWGRQLGKTGTLATSLGTLNPFRYRGYVYDEETGLYYLRSRYYNPGWGRFVNADRELVSGNMVRFLNLFGYCGNAPVAKIDGEGTSELSVQFAQVYGQYAQNITQTDGPYPFADILYLGFGAIAFISLGVYDVVSPAVQRLFAPSQEFEQATAAAISVPTDLASPVSNTSSPRKRRYEMHHIVAQKAPNAAPARQILYLCGISVHDPRNLVPISYEFHRVLHNNGYYGYVNSVIISAYNAGKASGTEKQRVYNALNQLRTQLFLWDSISGL